MHGGISVATMQAKQDAPDWRDLLIAGGCALIGFALFLWRISDPAKLNFDETHYVPAARIIADFAALPNPEHPPLGKLLIALSMTLFGDTPVGWRVLSAVAGAFTLFSGVMAARWLFMRRAPAVMTGALLLLSPTLFIQARIAMLDIFLTCFLMLAFWFLAAAVRTGGTDRWRLVLGGASLGLAIACKWTAVPLALLGVPLTPYLLWRASDEPASPNAARIPFGEVAAWLIPFAMGSYLLTFLPYMFLRTDALSLLAIIPQQFEMLRLQSLPMGTHPYQSVWWQWVLDLRPIWYFYEPVAGVQRGVLFLGNPVICWGGLVALGACLWAGLRRGAPALLVPVALWAAPLLLFMLAPKAVQFYYHYLIPSLMLCFASAGALDHYFWQRGRKIVPYLAIGAAALIFLEFYPIISAAALGDPQDFNRWMWLESWR
jgi:dolichyl-phosphate-mannose-protein mannosyltransferase